MQPEHVHQLLVFPHPEMPPDYASAHLAPPPCLVPATYPSVLHDAVLALMGIQMSFTEGLDPFHYQSLVKALSLVIDALDRALLAYPWPPVEDSE